MGDSLTVSLSNLNFEKFCFSPQAGLGAGAHSLVELPLEYRGVAFMIGGDSDLKYSVTLPS
jgi:hypothetical protein